MIKGLVCSLILLAMIFYYQAFMLWLASASYVTFLVVAALVIILSLLKARAIDHSSTGRR